jgi:hypothetical protein
MAGKKNFVLRMDEHMYRALERWASDEFRSVNGQIEWLLDKSLKEAGRKKPKDESSPEADHPTEDAAGSD